MPPKVKITKEAILDIAVEIVRKEGAQAVNARTLASVLGCSTQPVFSNFENMEQLRLAMVERADTMCNQYIAREIEKGEYPNYKASGMAYIRFAKEEKELFKLLYMRDRTGETFPQPLGMTDQIETVVAQNTGLAGDQVKLFHLEMWAVVHGIASMVATGFVDLEQELVSRMLSDAYQGLRKEWSEKNGSHPNDRADETI